MIRVAYMGLSPDDATTFWRCAGVFAHIDDRNLSFTSIHGLTEYNWSSISSYDILFIQRPFAQTHVNLMNLAKDMNIKVITDYDDDLLNVPSHNSTAITYEEQKKNIKMCLHLSDEVWVTTPALKESYKYFNRNIHIIPTGWNDYMFPYDQKRKFNNRTQKAIYRGGPSHFEDINQNVNDIVETINGNLSWQFMFMGLEYKMIFDRTSDKNVYHVPPQTMIQYFHYINEENPNIVFFPLLNNKFNQSKSNISLIEATYAGACFMSNKQCAEFNLPFITDIAGGMKEPFRELTDDFFNRMKRYNEMAWEWICDERRLSELNKTRIDRLLENGTNS